ncbi:MAG: hypothetical protein N2712_07545 [Brevinematales bacterium]|nr:hypothetical protein [Brevinematales bacterium]
MKHFSTLTLLAMIFMLSLVMFSNVSFGETIEEIEDILVNYKEQGYKFVKKLSRGFWQVNLTTSQGYSKDVYVYVSVNNKNPNFDIVYVYTTIKIYTDQDIRNSLDKLVFALQRNSSEAEWGTFSLYNEQGKWYLDYNVKLRRMYADSTHVMNAIGWVVGAASVYEKQF